MERYRFSEQLQAAYESMQVPFAIYQFINKRVATLALSEGFCELFGYEDKAQAYYDMDHDMYKDTHPDDRARIADAAFRFATEGGLYDVIYRTAMKNGSGYRIVHALGRNVYTENGICLAHVWYTDEGAYAEEPHEDESELKRAMNSSLHVVSMEKARSYDFLTGLPNMTCFFERAEVEKGHIEQEGGQPILLYIDFSGMKFFNARHGFAEGDNMLQSFARLLSRTFSNENSCRIGADHFAVMTGEAGVEERLNRIFSEFGELYSGKTPPVHVGIYPYHIEEVPVSTACDRAKLACSSLKGSYTSAYCYYDTGLREEAYLKQYVIENFDTAIREKWIQVYLQPIVRAVNERVCDGEALARWNDPEKGVLSPAVFIPVLEETGLICRLDLYMLDRVLEAIRIQSEEGFLSVPHSINISRADFDACDIVEEIRKRVDAAGVRRDRITVEITESVIGSNLEFMKEQVERFRKLGFPVWMDDFGSGYSSVEVLQSIKFDVIKFDMSFLRQLDEGKERKVILTDLMRMATSLDTDTVCEGVETKSQVQFLREIGCSKLQGYYYSRPIPFDAIRAMHKSSALIENENPEESDYYESVGKVNLFDLGVVANDDHNAIAHTFSNIPIAVLELKDGEARYMRNNRAYQDFAKHFFGIDVADGQSVPSETDDKTISTWLSAVKQCGENGNRVFFDNKTPDGSVIHSFARRIAVNPVTGSTAVAIAVLSITEPDEKTTYADIAKSLAADYYNIYVIDLDTNDYIEYSSNVGGEELSIERHGKDFFESARSDTLIRIYEEDREPFLTLFTKENVLRDLDTQGVFTTTYRLIDTGTPMYVNMKITRMQGGNRIILGVSIIDAHMKQQEEEKKLRQEKITLGRIAALAGNYLALYIVDPATDQFVKYDSSGEYMKLGLSEKGEGFFTQVKEDGVKVVYPEDMERLLCVLTRDNVLSEIRQNGIFIHNYRLLIEGRYVPVSLRATLVKEADGEKIILGVNKLFAKEPTTNELGLIYSHIARALVRGYSELFYVNIDTDEFIEFQIDDNFDVLTETRRSRDFFEGCRRDVKLFVHPEDQDKFIRAMDRDFLKEELERSKVFELTYRRLRNGKPHFVKMNASRMEDDKSIVVMAVSVIDDEGRGCSIGCG